MVFEWLVVIYGIKVAATNVIFQYFTHKGPMFKQLCCCKPPTIQIKCSKPLDENKSWKEVCVVPEMVKYFLKQAQYDSLTSLSPGWKSWRVTMMVLVTTLKWPLRNTQTMGCKNEIEILYRDTWKIITIGLSTTNLRCCIGGFKNIWRHWSGKPWWTKGTEIWS